MEKFKAITEATCKYILKVAENEIISSEKQFNSILTVYRPITLPKK